MFILTFQVSAGSICSNSLKLLNLSKSHMRNMKGFLNLLSHRCCRLFKALYRNQISSIDLEKPSSFFSFRRAKFLAQNVTQFSCCTSVQVSYLTNTLVCCLNDYVTGPQFTNRFPNKPFMKKAAVVNV